MLAGRGAAGHVKPQTTVPSRSSSTPGGRAERQELVDTALHALHELVGVAGPSGQCPRAREPDRSGSSRSKTLAAVPALVQAAQRRREHGHSSPCCVTRTSDEPGPAWVVTVRQQPADEHLLVGRLAAPHGVSPRRGPTVRKWSGCSVQGARAAAVATIGRSRVVALCRPPRRPAACHTRRSI